jgi:hypothetical protein
MGRHTPNQHQSWQLLQHLRFNIEPFMRDIMPLCHIAVRIYIEKTTPHIIGGKIKENTDRYNDY